MKTLTALLLLIATNAQALTGCFYTDSKFFNGCCTAPSVASYVAAWRPDYTWNLLLQPGRDTADTGDLVTYLAANDPDVVGIDLAVNDPLNLGVTTTAASTVARLVALCDLVRADGAACVLFTPLHAPTTRGLALDHEQWTQEVADLLLSSGETVIDLRSAIDGDTWQTDCMDVWGLHPGKDACKRIIAGVVADLWP
jgi:hypothetical protein